MTLRALEYAVPPSVDVAFPTTAAQREVWLAAQLGADAATACSDAVQLRLYGALDVPRLHAAIAALCARHESLRATCSSDGLTMRVAAVPTPAIAWFDWSDRSDDERTAALAELRHAAVTDSVDLEQGPLARFTIVRLGADAHVVLIAVHQIVCDRWSIDTLVEDLGTLYDESTIVPNAGSPPPDAPASAFRAFAATQAEPAWIAHGEADERYWREQFATLPRHLDLPTDRARTPHPSYWSAREDHTFSTDLTKGLATLAAASDTNVLTALLGGFAALLARLSGQDELVVATTVAGQMDDSAERLLGQCATMLPIRLRTPFDLPFDSLLRQAASVSSAALMHRHAGFGQIAAVVRDAARTPLASAAFNSVTRRDALGFHGFRVTVDRVPRRAELFDLVVIAIESNDTVALECQYNTELFDALTVRRWLASYEQLLRAAIANPTMPIGRLAIRTRDDEAALDRCNATARTIPADLLVHELVEAEAEQSPDRVAIEQDNTVLRYDELNARANQLAHHLRGLGVQRGELVGLLLDRTPDTIVALLAVLKAGAGYVPLDPALPVERLEKMATDAALAALITNERIRDAVTISARELVSIDGDAGIIALSPPANPPRDEHRARPDDTAYVIFTSGSTGRPKGVLVPHIALLNLALSLRHTPGMQRDDVVLAITTLVFDVAVSEVLVPLTLGARIVLASRETAADGTQLRRLVESRGVTFICSAPATYHLLLDAGWRGNAGLTIICTGEAMPRELAATLVRCGRALWNAYGPSETTVWSTFHRVAEPVQRILIGRPIDNTCIAVCDAHGEPVPIGVVGELVIGGVGVATGYLNADDTTADRFRDDAHHPGLRWYRTGDLVRLLATGELECLGRADDQVKVRGYRIEPGEIAVVVSQWPGVRQAVVIAREDRANDVRLVAYVMADEGTQFDDPFRAHLKRILPQYMIPAAVVQLDAFPLTASGKIDRKRLPAPTATSATRELEFVDPRTPTEQMLVGVWAEALGGRVGIRDDFFALGGHSLLASQILSRLRRDHGVHLSFRRIFDAPTVEQLARVIDVLRADPAGAAVTGAEATGAEAAGAEATGAESTGAEATGTQPITRRIHAVTSPLTAQQERLCMLEELEPNRRRAHSHPASWLLTGPLDLHALQDALQAMTERHPILRTSFHWRDGDREQRVHEHVVCTLGRVDLRDVPAAEQAQALHECFVAQHEVPFDIGVAPLFRATLIALGPQQHQLYTLQHGLIWDGWSFDLFVRDLGELYAAAVEHRSPMLAPLSITFGDFAAWQRAWLRGSDALAQQAWWSHQLAGAQEAVSMPTDRPRPVVSSYAGAYVSVAFCPAEVSALQRLGRRYDGTLYMVLLAAYAALLHRYTGQRDLLVASPMRARTQTELEDVLGPFVNAVVLRVHVDAATSFADLVRRVRDTALDTFSHQELPFELLGGTLPAIRTVFSLQDARERPRTFGNIEAELAPVPLQFAANDLTLWMQQYPDRMSAVLNFSTELFDEDSARLFLDQLRALLQVVLETPEQPLVELAVSSDDDVQGADVPPVGGARLAPTPVLSAIARVASDHAAAIAVQQGNMSATYGSLWTRAGAVAAALARRGVGADVVVAVSLPSGVDRIVATLGVLRAGAQLLAMSPDDGVEYQALTLAAASPVLRIGARAGPGTAANPPAVTLAVLLSDTEGTVVPNVGEGDAGILMAWPDVDGDVRIMRVPASRVDAQAEAITTTLALSTGVGVCFAVPAGAPANTLGLLAVLASGARLVLADDEAADDARDLSEDASSADCTRLIATAEVWRTTLDDRWAATRFERGLLIGGGLSADELASIVANGTALVAATGGVHDGTLSALLQVRAETPNWFVGVPIGSSVFRVVDERDRSLPAGMPGRLESRRADLDAAWIPTGLHGRRTGGGEFQLLVGTDAILWCDGAPVSRRLLERMIRQVPGVADAAIERHADRRGRPWLVAHVLVEAGWDVVDLRAQCRGRLPAAWLPKRFVSAAAIPRDAEGVVVRAALQSPFESADLASSAPRTAEERMLVDVWSEVLGVERISRDDNFFARGGTSLSCFRAIELIRSRTSARLSPRVLLTGTLAQAAAQLASHHGGAR